MSDLLADENRLTAIDLFCTEFGADFYPWIHWQVRSKDRPAPAHLSDTEIAVDFCFLDSLVGKNRLTAMHLR